MNARLILFLCTIMYIGNSCSKADNDFSILEPEFVRHHLKEFKIDGVTRVSVKYSPENRDQISTIEYFDAQGNLIPNYTETITYENHKISRKVDQSLETNYTYNSKGDIETVKQCYTNSSSCWLNTFIYDYTQHNLPQSKSVAGTNGYTEETIYEYKNLANRSFISFTTSNQNNDRVIKQKIKNINGIIDPFFEFDPSQFDYYLDNILQDFNQKVITETEVNETLNDYPVKLTVSDLDQATLQIIRSYVYTYEYY